MGLSLVPNQIEGKAGHGPTCLDPNWTENLAILGLQNGVNSSNGPQTQILKTIVKRRRIIKDDKQKNTNTTLNEVNNS